eukprot:3857696-Pyramimonas_sp.AAC.1
MASRSSGSGDRWPIEACAPEKEGRPRKGKDSGGRPANYPAEGVDENGARRWRSCRMRPRPGRSG